MLFPEDQLSELRGRVAEVEARLGRLEVAQPSEARSRLVPVASPHVSPPSPAPTPASSEWPSAWTPAPATSSTAPADARSGQAPQSQESADVVFDVVTAPITTGAPTTTDAPDVVRSAGAFLGPPAPGDEPGHSLLDWETLVGGRLALWVGALCLFLALSSLLVYVGQTLPPPTPAMRVASGLAASLALFAGAFGARKRAQRWFVDGLLGAGLAVGFLSVWGGGPHFTLWSLPVSVAGFAGLSALGMTLSARRDSRALLVLAATGGFLTPILVQGSAANELALAFLSYLLALDAGIVGVCVAKKWRDIVWGAFAATALLALGWTTDANIEAMRPMLWVFASFGWLMFAGAACYGALRRSDEFDESDSGLLFCASGLYALASQWLLAPMMTRFPGAFSLGLTLVFGALWLVSRRRAPSSEALALSFLTMACVAGAGFVPLQFGAQGLVWGWMAQAVGLSFVGRKSGGRLLRGAGTALWARALLSLGMDAFLWTAGTFSPFDALGGKLLFCVGATALPGFDARDEQEKALFTTAFSWGGALWIARTVWLTIPHLSWLVPAQRSEAAVLLGASAVVLWSLGLWRAGAWRGQKELRVNALLVLGSALCAIAGVALWGQAAPVAVRVAAFVVGALALGWMGSWFARDDDEPDAARETTSLGVAVWAILGVTIEVAAHWAGGRFAIPGSGETAWFALCGAWSLLAAGAGALSVWRAWPRLWTLAQALFAVSTALLLVQSLLVPHSLEPLWNARLGAFGAAWSVAWLARRVDGQGRRGDWWLLPLLLLPLWASTQELWNGVATHHALFGHEWQRFASLGVSLLWSSWAAACLVGGVVGRAQNVRVGALAVCKVFLLDLSFLDGGLRVLSLGGLGLALLFISWLYGRLKRSEMAGAA